MQITRNKSVLILSFLNTEKPGLLNEAMLAETFYALHQAERDDSYRAVIITGQGQDFCRGRDVQEFLSHAAHANNLGQLPYLIEQLRHYPKPIIAAVEGAAHDAGFALALAADFIIAGQSAQFACTMMKMALTAEAGLSWFLTHLLPRQLVNELLFESKPMLATRLQQSGIIKQVVADGSSLDAALRLANRLTELPPGALERVKGLLNTAQDATLAQQIHAENLAFLECLHHHEAEEGITAYLEKRKARF